MNAPDFQTLYAIESLMENGIGPAFNTGLKGMLIANSVVQNIYTQRENVEKITPRIELKFSCGTATGHQSVDNAGIFRYDAWSYNLEILFVTDRQENFSAHNTMLGMVRGLMENLKTNVNLSQFFPYTWIALAKQSGTVPGFHADDDTDMSAVKYSGDFFILPNSWPV